MKKILMSVAVAVATMPAFAFADDYCDYEEQVEKLAMVMYTEARGEGADGMQMVGETVLNRLQSEKHPDTICGVVSKENQYDGMKHAVDSPEEEEKWETALFLAEGMVQGKLDLFNNGATHFLNPDEVKKMPKWAKVFPVVGSVGKHVFYKEIDA